MYGAENSWTLLIGRVLGRFEIILCCFSFILQNRKLRLRENRGLAQKHTELQPEPGLGLISGFSGELALFLLLLKGSRSMRAPSGLTVREGGPGSPGTHVGQQEAKTRDTCARFNGVQRWESLMPSGGVIRKLGFEG